MKGNAIRGFGTAEIVDLRLERHLSMCQSLLQLLCNQDLIEAARQVRHSLPPTPL